MKFWIRINGLQEGPMEIDQMKQYNITPTTYVWCAGMKDWAYARDVDDLKEVLQQCTNENVPTPPTNPETLDIDTANDVVETNEVEEFEPQIDDKPAEEEDIANEPIVHTAPVVDEPQQSAPTQPETDVKSKDVPPCPPTNLVWSILATVLCCQVLGIIAIVFSAQVTSKYNTGDYTTAKKYSEWSAWLVIASIVLSILWSSFALPFMIIAEMM